ncbi:carboxypeptidase regulatory-like domain-containing protein [Singulisphaera sp. PoT]|uniref:carboxypeptidase regulatory-like domain-containing protein n=1 Tax=Singulisphaera sp. PoT TaxID=3411797 RepID=UPI003BF5C1E3
MLIKRFMLLATTALAAGVATAGVGLASYRGGQGPAPAKNKAEGAGDVFPNRQFADVVTRVGAAPKDAPRGIENEITPIAKANPNARIKPEPADQARNAEGPTPALYAAAQEPKAEPKSDSPAAPEAAKSLTSPRQREKPKEWRGVVLGPDGQPVTDAILVAGAFDVGRSGHQILKIDAQGRFAWTLPEDADYTCLVIYKKGLAADVLAVPADALANPLDLKLRLGKAEPFRARLVDEGGKPLAAAKVRVTTMSSATETKHGSGSRVSMSFERVPREVVAGSPVEELFTTTTGADGSFTFEAIRPQTGLKLEATDAGGKLRRIRAKSDSPASIQMSLESMGFSTAQPGETTKLVAVPAARISGRVVSTLPEVGLTGLKAGYQSSHPPGAPITSGNTGADAIVDPEGRFAFDGLAEGTVNVFVRGKGENKTWTYRAAKDVKLTPGSTSEITLEIIRGVEVEGTVVAKGTATPMDQAEVGVYGPFRPKSGAMTTGAMTDAKGRYHYLLPPGETYFYVMGPPEGYTTIADEGSSRTVKIPEGASRFEVPPLEVVPAVTVRGKVIDTAGAPVVGAKIIGVCQGNICEYLKGGEATTDAKGEFRLPVGAYNTVAADTLARLRVRLGDGSEQDAAIVPGKDGEVLVKVAVVDKNMKEIKGPTEIAPEELAGVVVDADGKPIEGAEVDVWSWYPGNEAKTDGKGFFQVKGLDKGSRVEVIVSKPGYTPQLFLTQPTGAPNWVVALSNKTFFEGQVTGPDGKPVAGALLRANRGPKEMDGGRITGIWTEATTDAEGRYRMYAQADAYDIQVRVPGVGVARLPQTPLEVDEAKHLDIRLEPGVAFRAKLVDSLTGEPVPGVRLWHRQHNGIEGRSGKDGVVEIAGMMPGRFNFQVDGEGYARWWSEEAVSEWSRFQILDGPYGRWQRNFDELDYDLRVGMKPVTIVVERGVTVSGRVLDPAGKPVVGATVAPALTGSGNSLTGDTRFSVATGEGGQFKVVLPASGERDYNLIAHDGKYGEWRTWANGVLPPIRTKPGEEIRDVELHLTEPAKIRGRVTDSAGHPVAETEVQASSTDGAENRYYVPTARTSADGSYELKFIRPCEQFIQVAPFWLDARNAPASSSRILTLTKGEVQEGVNFEVAKAPGSK